MERLFRAHQDKGFVVVAINLHESAKTVRPFVQQLKLSFPIALDAEGSVTREYGVRALPVTFLVGRDRLRYEIVVNYVDKDRIRGYLSTPKDKLVAADTPALRRQ